MAKVSTYTELTSLSGDETFYVVEDDDGTPVSRRITVENLRDGLLSTVRAVKTSDESVTSSTTLQVDNELVLALTVATWEIDGLLLYDASTAGDLKATFDASGGLVVSSFVAACLGAGAGSSNPATIGVAPITALGTTRSFGGLGAGSPAYVMVRGRVVVTTGGNLELQWAQNTSDGTASKVLTGSWLKAVKV